MIGLTRKQSELLAFIRERNQTGVSPSFQEMNEAMGLRSKSGVHRLIIALEERGHIRRLPGRARALEVVEQYAGLHDTLTLHPEVRAAAVSYAKRHGMTLPTALAIAARAYFCGDKAA